MKNFILFFVMASIVIAGCNSQSAKKTAPSHDEMMAKASRSEKNGWIVVHLEGSPYEIGYQHGYLGLLKSSISAAPSKPLTSRPRAKTRSFSGKNRTGCCGPVFPQSTATKSPGLPPG